MRLQPFKFTIQIVKGKENIVAGAVFRIPWKIEHEETFDEDSAHYEHDFYNFMLCEALE